MSSMLPITPSSSELWRKFIDPIDWQPAHAMFPEEPWRFYIKPIGDYDPNHWPFFISAVQWIYQKAERARAEGDFSITLKDILSVNSLILNGTAERWRESLRDYRPIFNLRTQAEITTIYENGTCFYKNDDQLKIRIDGFMREDYSSIDLFLICRKLSKINYHQNPHEWLALSQQFRQHLSTQIDQSNARWNAYYLSNTEELVAQIESILAWYQQTVTAIGDNPPAILELAVKMQRYLDICQYCLDGSSRTSKLIHDYIFLIFGLSPPNPVIYFFDQKPYSNGTYIPLANAIEMAQLGLMPLDSTGDRLNAHSAALDTAAPCSARQYIQNG